jgi:hypothetical protein
VQRVRREVSATVHITVLESEGEAEHPGREPQAHGGFATSCHCKRPARQPGGWR